LVTSLATLLVSLTTMAVNHAAPWKKVSARPEKPNQGAPQTTDTVTTSTHRANDIQAAVVKISRDDLKRLGGISLGLAVLSLLLPRRSPAADVQNLTPQIVAQSTGLPIVASLLAAKRPRRRSGGRILGLWVSTAECIICAAVALTMTAYILNPELFAVLRKNPLTGYLYAVHQLTDTVTSWLAPRLPLA
jgi:hypothetical protein